MFRKYNRWTRKYCVHNKCIGAIGYYSPLRLQQQRIKGRALLHGTTETELYLLPTRRLPTQLSNMIRSTNYCIYK